MDWDLICRVCMGNGEMQSIYELDEDGALLCDNIMLCSNIQIKEDDNLPQHICKKCLYDLSIAMSFRNNCQSTDEVLKSILKNDKSSDLLVYSKNGSVFHYKPPEGLNVKRVRKESTESEFYIENFTYEPESQDDKIIETAETIDYECEVINEKGENKFDIKDEPMHYEQGACEIYEKEAEYKEETEYQEETEKKNDEQKPTIEESGGYQIVTETVTDKKGKKIFRIKKRDKQNKSLYVYICEICGNTYKYRHALETHMRRHRNEKPFVCELCKKAFVSNVELNCHMRTHTGEKPYPCRFCSRRFSDFGSRIKHERSHTGERPYKCDTCGKAFAYSYGLSSHMLIHTGEKRYECEKCGRKFSKKHHLKNHLNTHKKYEARDENRASQLKVDQAIESDYPEIFTTFTLEPGIVEGYVCEADIDGNVKIS